MIEVHEALKKAADYRRAARLCVTERERVPYTGLCGQLGKGESSAEGLHRARVAHETVEEWGTAVSV